MSSFEPNNRLREILIYFFNLKKSAAETDRLLGMIQKWFTEFRCGRTNTEAIPIPGRPNEITTPEMINKIHDIVLLGYFLQNTF